ncbi:hypothetical protein [Caballeronia sp. TF1N1]|uniref:hypothetical protein n=1 Tax=Caballeronia sp. TF1N1 TaxID=2878153 RepID=UPI001FD20AB4|nr:hypothetical protein [Caballeronia sp. TF1N1]
MNQQNWEVFFPHEKRTWAEFKAQYDLDGLAIPYVPEEPRKKGRKQGSKVLLITTLLTVALLCIFGMVARI